MHNETRKYVSSDGHQTSLAGVGFPSPVRSHVWGGAGAWMGWESLSCEVPCRGEGGGVMVIGNGHMGPPPLWTDRDTTEKGDFEGTCE